MGDVVAFRDPYAALEGEELEAALAIADEHAQEICCRAVWRAITELSQVPGCEKLGIESAAKALTAGLLSAWSMCAGTAEPPTLQ